MTLTCPCCKAANATPLCRRCKADLSLLFAAEARRGYHVALARRFASELRTAEALAHLQSASAIRPAADITQLRAALLLLAGRSADALAAYDATV